MTVRELIKELLNEDLNAIVRWSDNKEEGETQVEITNVISHGEINISTWKETSVVVLY